MAKQAKAVEIEITDRVANKFVRDILEHYEAIDSARGTFMNKARREREAMATIYEGMTTRGISQKASKTNIKIVRALQKVQGWMADLESEDRKMAQKMAKAQGDKKQLMLWSDLPPLPKPTKAERAREEKAAAKPPKPEADLETQAAAGEA